MAFDFLGFFKDLNPTAKEIFKSYVDKGEVDNRSWLEKILADNKYTSADSQSIADEIFSSVGRFNTNLQSIEQAAREKKTKEQWLKDFIEKNPNLTEQQKNEYLTQANMALRIGNRVMMNVMDSPTTIDISETINQLVKQELPTANSNTMNRYDRVYVAEQVGLQAGLIGLNGTLIPNEIAETQEEEIFQQDLTEETSGSKLDEGVKMATAVALKIGHAAGKIPFLPKAMPMSAITNIACVGVETFKNIGRVATGKISPLQALENVGRASVAAIADFCTTGLPAKLLAPIPVVGPVLSVAVGGLLTQCSSKAIQEKIHAGVDKVKKVVSTVTTTIKEGVKTVFNKAKSVFSKAKDFLFSFF